MIYNVYCVKDEKVEFQAGLFLAHNDELAIHSFASGFVNTNPAFGRFEDYSLYCVGTYDTSIGSIVPHEPRFVIHGLNARNSAIERLKKLNLESEVLNNDNGNLATETES